MPCHYGKNCLLFLFFCIYTDNRIFAFFVLVYQLVNFLKLLISIFTCFHCDSFLHFSLYKTMLLQKLLYHMWRYIHTLSLIHISEPTRRTPISYAVFCLKKKKAASCLRSSNN